MRLPTPQVTKREDYYRFTWEGTDLEIELERFAEEDSHLTAGICIRARGQHITRDRINLESRRSRETLAKSLVRPTLSPEKKAEEQEIWLEALEQICEITVSDWRDGEPPIDIMTLTPSRQREWLLEPFLEKKQNCVIFGHGGVRKSTIALGMAVSVASGCALVGVPYVEPCPVMYCDWESDEETIYERVSAILNGHGITLEAPIYYQRMSLSLSQMSGQLRKKIEKYKVGMVVYDSLGAAKHGEIHTNEASMTVFRAARSLGIPWIGIDHMSWDTIESDRAPRPFGGVYTWNLGRSFWHMEGGEDEGDTAVLLTNVKANNTKKRDPLAYRIRYQTENDWLVSLRFEPCDPRDIPSLHKHLNLADQIILALRKGPSTEDELAEQLGKSKAMIHKTLYTMRENGKVLKLPKDKKWGILAQEINQ
jgi:hypothetical protein